MCVWISWSESITLSLDVVRSSVLHLSRVFSSRRLLHRYTLLLPNSHHVILISVYFVIKNDVGKVIRIVASKSTDCFSHEAILVVMLVVVVLISIIAINKTLASTMPELEFSIEWASLMSSLAGETKQPCGLLALPFRYGKKRMRVVIVEPDTMKRIHMKHRVMNDITVGATPVGAVAMCTIGTTSFGP